MKFVIVLLAVIALNVDADHLVIGNVADRVKLAKHEKVEYNAIPFMKRVKMYFFTLEGDQKIQGIQALDTYHSKASINITAGGLGYSYVNMRLKSERGRGLSYDIGFYVDDPFYRH